MELHKLADSLSVTGQIEPNDIPILAEQGIRAIICNRPDGEAPGQPSYAEIAAAAKAKGIESRYQPVVSGAIGDEDVQAFGEAIGSLPKPVVAYCRSGTRSAALWSLSQAGKRSAEEILHTAMEAGYDLRALLPRLEKHE